MAKVSKLELAAMRAAWARTKVELDSAKNIEPKIDLNDGVVRMGKIVVRRSAPDSKLWTLELPDYTHQFVVEDPSRLKEHLTRVINEARSAFSAPEYILG